MTMKGLFLGTFLLAPSGQLSEVCTVPVLEHKLPAPLWRIEKKAKGKLQCGSLRMKYFGGSWGLPRFGHVVRNIPGPSFRPGGFTP